jgi:NAD+ synthase (glutamine-hydrolysing)
MMKLAKQKIKIALAQINPRLGDLAYNLNLHLEYIEEAGKQGADIIVFPELSLTGYALKDAVYDVARSYMDSYLLPLYKASAAITVCFGMVELSNLYEAKNSSIFLEQGDCIARHRKVYLPTYGVFEEKRYFTPGNRFRAFDSKFGRFGMLICEDIWHPTSTMVLARDGALAIFVGSAGLLRGVTGSEKPDIIQAWESINRTSALLFTSYFIFCNRVGNEDGLLFWGGSEIIDPHGTVVVKAPYFKETLVYAEIDWLKIKHARIHTTLVSDERLDIVMEELKRIDRTAKEY